MGATPNKPSLQEIVKQIESGTEEYRDAATELTNRIKIFEAWLNKLPGKVEAHYSEQADFYNDRILICLQLERTGKEWALHCYKYDESADQVIGTKMLLRDASVETKSRVMRLFPKLLNSIRTNQVHFVEEAKKIASDFDKFAESLGIKGEV